MIEALRWTVLVLSLSCLCWSVPAAARAVLGNLSAECGFAIAWTAILTGFIGFQIGYLLEGVSYSQEPRDAVNLALIIIGLLLAHVAWWIRTREIEAQYGRVTLSRRLWRRLFG